MDQPRTDFATDRARWSTFRWSLAELLACIALMAFCTRLVSLDATWVATALFVVVVGTRVAIFDYSLLGSVATALVITFGTFLIFLIIIWASLQVGTI